MTHATSLNTCKRPKCKVTSIQNKRININYALLQNTVSVSTSKHRPRLVVHNALKLVGPLQATRDVRTVASQFEYSQRATGQDGPDVLATKTPGEGKSTPINNSKGHTQSKPASRCQRHIGVTSGCHHATRVELYQRQICLI